MKFPRRAWQVLIKPCGSGFECHSLSPSNEHLREDVRRKGGGGDVKGILHRPLSITHLMEITFREGTCFKEILSYLRYRVIIKFIN